MHSMSLDHEDAKLMRSPHVENTTQISRSKPKKRKPSKEKMSLFRLPLMGWD